MPEKLNLWQNLYAMIYTIFEKGDDSKLSNEILRHDRGEAIRKRDISIEDLRLEYTLYESMNAHEARYVYSVSVSCGTEFACADDISSLRIRADELFEILSGGAVTPCTLFEVLEDIL